MKQRKAPLGCFNIALHDDVSSPAKHTQPADQTRTLRVRVGSLPVKSLLDLQIAGSCLMDSQAAEPPNSMVMLVLNLQLAYVLQETTRTSLVKCMQSSDPTRTSLGKFVLLQNHHELPLMHEVPRFKPQRKRKHQRATGCFRPTPAAYDGGIPSRAPVPR